jgi:hypothetical protein
MKLNLTFIQVGAVAGLVASTLGYHAFENWEFWLILGVIDASYYLGYARGKKE